jgi:hypothetical protein
VVDPNGGRYPGARDASGGGEAEVQGTGQASDILQGRAVGPGSASGREEGEIRIVRPVEGGELGRGQGAGGGEGGLLMVTMTPRGFNRRASMA